MTTTGIQNLRASAIAGKVRMIAAVLLLGFVAILTASVNAKAAEEVNIQKGHALHGYDVVAYFTDSRPTEGSDEFTAVYQGATYRFASAVHRDAFTADPAKYAPQYGGYCAFGAAFGRKFNGDPHAWRIVDGKLYLNLNKSIQARWLTDTAGFIRGANNNWPVISSFTDADLAANPPAGLTQGAV